MSVRQKFYGWKLVAVLFFLYLLNLGFPLYGGLIVHSYMVKKIAMNRATFGLGMTVFNIVMGVMSPLIAAAITRWGIRVALLIGSALLLLGSLVMANTTQPWQYILGFGVLMGAGAGFGTTVTLTTSATRWFRRYRGRAIGIIMAAGGIGGFVVSPAMNRLMVLNGGNWHQAWLLIGGCCILGGIIAYLFVKEDPSDLGQFQDGIAPDSSTKDSAKAFTQSADYHWTAAEGYKTLAYWLIVFVGFAMYFPYFLVQAHWIFHMKGIGLSAADAAWTMGLFTLSGVFGRMIGGWFQDIFPARFVFVVGLALMASGIALGGLFSAGSVLLAYLASVILGFGFGSSLTNLPTILGNYFGHDAFSKLYGTAFMIALVIASFAGILGGKLFDVFHSYHVAWEICIAISAAGIVALFFTVPPQPVRPSQ